MRLLRRADFHVGAHVNTFWRTPCRGAAEGPSKKSVVWENKHITWFGEHGAGVGAGQWWHLGSKSCGSFCPEGPTTLPEAPRLYGGTRVDAGGAAWETRGQIQEQVGGSREEKDPGGVHAAKVWAEGWGPCETGKDCWGRALDLLNASQVK